MINQNGPLCEVDGVRGGKLAVTGATGYTKTGSAALVVVSLPMHGGVQVVLDAQGACEVVRALSDWLASSGGEVVS